MTVPCKGCRDRQVGCHARCEGYLRFAEENRKRLEARKIENALNCHEMDGKLKNIKRNRKHG